MRFSELMSNWEKFGTSQPFSAVLTDFEETCKDEFFALGPRHVEDLLGLLQQLGWEPRSSALDASKASVSPQLRPWLPGVDADYAREIHRLHPLTPLFQRSISVVALIMDPGRMTFRPLAPAPCWSSRRTHPTLWPRARATVRTSATAHTSPKPSSFANPCGDSLCTRPWRRCTTMGNGLTPKK